MKKISFILFVTFFMSTVVAVKKEDRIWWTTEDEEASKIDYFSNIRGSLPIREQLKGTDENQITQNDLKTRFKEWKKKIIKKLCRSKSSLQ